MSKKSINPYNQEVLGTYKTLSDEEVNRRIKKAEKAYETWKTFEFKERSKLMRQAAGVLRSKKESLARTITLEMGKPIPQSIAEIEKCAWVCEYYAEHAELHLASRGIKTDASESYVSYEPLGVVLAIMPWNYPFWQVFRFAAPALMAGNTALLKHASNVIGCGNLIEGIFREAGFPEASFQHFIIDSSQVPDILKNNVVRAVTLTGSEDAGAKVASEAALNIKKSVLELGGSNAMVVFEDADLEATLKTCIQARFQNTGQSCIAGKRLLLQESIAAEFEQKFIQKVKELVSGDPMNPNTFIGTLARKDLADTLYKQMKASLEKGARLRVGGKQNGAYFEPTVLTDVTPEMEVFREETFGPLIGITTFKTSEDAVRLVNSSRFGLGVSLFTENKELALSLIPKLYEGAVFVNELVKSDPRLPFGGVKTSGYGRELSEDGIREFVNKKTVYFK